MSNDINDIGGWVKHETNGTKSKRASVLGVSRWLGHCDSRLSAGVFRPVPWP